MKWQQLVAIGRRQGLVRWARSGRIEQLSVNGMGQLVASTMLTKETHVLRDLYPDYHCRELHREDRVSLSDLLL